MIRAAKHEDADALGQVHVAAWRAAYPHLFPAEVLAALSEEERADRWREMIARAPGNTLVLDLDGGIGGFALMGPVRDPDLDPERVGELQALYLDPELWGMGHGRALWEAARQWFIVREYATVTLWVLEGNVRARTFYENAGFRVEPESRRLFTRQGVSLPELRYRRPAE